MKAYAVPASVVLVCLAAGQALQSASTSWPPAPVPIPSNRPKSPVTFSKEVVRILQGHCQVCHHEGGIGPFPLVTYSEVFPRRDLIRQQTSAREMPTWQVDSAGAAYQDDPSLTEEEIGTIARWVESGAPEGNSEELPEPREFPSQWSLGEPDLTLELKEAYTPDFSNGDVYRCFVLPTGLPKDRYVTATEVAPGNRAMVHHALLYVEEGTVSEELIRDDPADSYPCFGGPRVAVSDGMGEWAPGNEPHFFPPGVARLLPKGARVIMQVHYSARNGSVTPDRTAVGLHFATSPVKKRLFMGVIYGPDNFVIPAGASAHTLKGTASFESDVHLVGILPHMHLLGRTMSVKAMLPGGTEACLVDVLDWDIRYQRTYRYPTAVALPAGTRLELVATYDNSSENPRNPNDPPREVRLGEQTTDEMCLALLYWTADSEDPEKALWASPEKVLRSTSDEGVMSGGKLRSCERH